jgi:hypothetical protein
MKEVIKVLLISFIVLIWLVLVFGCKTRHVATTKSDITTNEVLTKSVKKDSSTVDTGKVKIENKKTNDIQDSAEVDIQTDTGVQKITIQPNGLFTYSGKAKGIIYKKKTTDHSTTDRTVQNNKGLTTHISTADSSSDKKQMHQVTKVKTTDAKADHGWVVALLVVIALVSIGGYLAWKYKFG